MTNVVGCNFGGSDLSYGYFNANGSSFPFQNGIVLSTGKLVDVPGPNITLSDDDASGWDGTLNGYALPSDDYWFLITFDDGRTYRGHFALVR